MTDTNAKRRVFYCKSWFRANKRPIELWRDETARTAHEAGSLYTALIGSKQKPSCFLEIVKGFVGVGFLDAQQREFLSYSFQESIPGKLFLSMATHREFDGQTDTVSSGTTYLFKADGSLTVWRERYRPHEKHVAESVVDVSTNLSAWPTFGQYDDLIRIERGVTGSQTL
jgi:hypothetical protein